MNEQPDLNNPESVERSMLDPTERISVSTPVPQPIDDLGATPTPASPAVQIVTVTRPTGPAPLSLALGVLLLAVAVVLTLHETVDFRVDWDYTGPLALLGGGVVLALAGLIGMRRRS